MDICYVYAIYIESVIKSLGNCAAKVFESSIWLVLVVFHKCAPHSNR